MHALNRNAEDSPKNKADQKPFGIKMNRPDDPDCFVVDGAMIECSCMHPFILREHFYAASVGRLYPGLIPEQYPDIGRLSAVQAEYQTAGRLRFATVKDCVCQRDVDQGKADKASIISMGYCQLYEEGDKEAIRENEEKSVEYGTCYCLIDLVSEWTNSRSKKIRQ